MEVKVKLNNRSTEEKVNVDLQWNVNVLKKKSGLAKCFRKFNRVSRDLKLSVSDINVPDEVVCDKNRLFSILYNGKEVLQKRFPVDVHLSDMKMPFQLLFYHGEIKDCQRQQDDNPRKYPITFKVNLLDLKNKVVDSVNGQIDLIFEPLGIKPKFDISLVNEKIQYASSIRRKQVGTFVAWIEDDFQYTPDQLVTVSLKLLKANGSHPQELPDFVSFENRETTTKKTIKGGSTNALKIPVYVDFTNIYNPINDEEDFVIETTIIHAASYSPGVRETILKQKHFKLLKDKQGTELKVFIKKSVEPELCQNNHTIVTDLLRFVPRGNLSWQIDVILCNIATDNSNPNAGLYIKNLTLRESLGNQDVRVLGADGTILSNEFIRFDGPNVDSMTSPEGFFLCNGIESKTTINLSFDPCNIVELVNSPKYNFQIDSILTFDYWEDKDGRGTYNDEDKKTFSIPVRWRLHLEPNPEWLCVDYGSSAIVCSYDNKIINLRERKNAIFYGTDWEEDTAETGTCFLSSDVVLHTVNAPNASTLCSEHDMNDNVPYTKLSVCLSPTTSLIRTDVRTQLPCLKILVGNEFLPANDDFMTFQYMRRNGAEVAPVQVRDALANNEETCLLRVSSIFLEAYSALFKYFIFPMTENKSINKLVLTYPNTYTPVHLRTLENIARKTFPKVRDEYLRFVSESDAVAAYYISNWETFQNNEVRNMRDDEIGLVYDMGAGTLDLTLFKKHHNNESGKFEVSILGKIGTGKAGNYLDYIIAQIIYDRIVGAIRFRSTVSTEAQPSVQILLERLAVKEQIKEKIKPALRPGNDLTWEIAANGNVVADSFDSSVILEDERFMNFLSQVTEGIISHLLSYVGDPNLRIDTVIMSGRSCRLGAIKTALMENYTDARILNLHGEGDEDKEKTAVVEGAMIRANIFSSPESPVIIKSRRLYASYGLIYRRLGGEYCYTELLRSADLPLTDNNQFDDYFGRNITVEGTAATDSIKLIQTYLSPDDTRNAFARGDFEFISVMEEYDRANFGGRNELNVQMKIDYKNNVSVYFDGQVSRGRPPMGVDLTSEITKRSIWPVTI
ncbi:MAG: hypothetical protein LUC91_05765 [Prevotella sp.]|nr:hypothetical protein [Prevotella sp.]